MNVTLVAPHPYCIESAMLPGYVAGDYVLEDLRIALDGLVEASGAPLRAGARDLARPRRPARCS